jgi:hypothetical protein
MDNKVWEVKRVTLDGVYFRTAPSQRDKGTITDNSCIIGMTDVVRTDRRQRQGSRNRRAGVRKERCYGVVQKFYMHFMYPPDPDELVKATEDGRIDPSLLTVPWSIFADCEWYESMSDKHPVNKLPQCVRNTFWDACPLISMRDVLPMNCVFWPSNPFSWDDFDGNGTFKFKNKKEEFPESKKDDTLVVVTHHEGNARK